MPKVPKETIIEMLDDRAVPFAIYCMNATTDNAKAVRFLFENATTIDINSPVFKDQLVPLLLSEGVIDQGVLDRLEAFRQSGG